MPAPRSANALIIRHMARRASGSTPEVGSSRKIASGSCITAAPTPTRCFHPPVRDLVSPPPARAGLPQHARLATGFRSFEDPFFTFFAHGFIDAIKPRVKIQVLSDGQ